MAHFRESNALHLEILEVVPVEGVPIEVDIFDGSNPGTMLEHLEGAEGVKFSLTMNEEGAGEFRLSRGDPKATPEVIDREHLAKVKMGGVYRFSFWMENRKIVTLTEEEEGGEYWHVSGREGTYAYLDRATMDRVSHVGDDPIEGVYNLTAAGTGNKLGQMLRRVLEESENKSPSPLEFLGVGFDYDVDSHGAVWTQDADVQVNVGTHVLPIAKMLSALGVDLRARHDLRLDAYEDLGRHFEIDGGTGSVVFRAGQNVTTSLERTTEPGILSRLLVKGTGDQFFEVIRPDLEADPYIRRRESYLSFGNSDDPTTIQRAGEAELAAREARRGAISFGADHDRGRGGYEPFVDYDLGDWATLDEPGVYDLETVRIVGITVEQEEDDYAVYLDANSIVLEEILKVARKIQNGGSGGSGGSSTSSVGGGSGGGGSISSPAKVAVEAGDLPGYLYGKLEAGDGITKSISGPSGNRTVRLEADVYLASLGDVDPTGLADDDVFAWDATAGLFVPRPRGSGGGGGAEEEVWREGNGPAAHAQSREFTEGSTIGTLSRVAHGTPKGTWSEVRSGLEWLQTAAIGTEMDVFVIPLSLAIGDHVSLYGSYYRDQPDHLGPFVGFTDGAVFGTSAALGTFLHFSGNSYRSMMNTWPGMNSRTQDGTIFDYPYPILPFGWRIKWEAANTFGLYHRPNLAGKWRRIQANYARTFTPTHVAFGMASIGAGYSADNPARLRLEAVRINDAD